MEIELKLQELILRDYDNPFLNETCACGKGKCLVRCRYDGCFQYQTSCRECFISSHRHNPFHWALEWDTTKNIWVQRDISELSVKYAIQLGHVHTKNHELCSGADSIPFTVTHTNGIHTTRLRFCCCPDGEDKVMQLLQAKLFPSTPNEPRSAFTFATLRHFHMHNLQSKCGSFDFILSLRRLTDNIFTFKVPVRILLINLNIIRALNYL